MISARNAYWKQSPSKTVMGFLSITPDHVTFAKDETDYSSGSVKIMSRRAHNQEKASGFLGGLFKKAANVVEEFQLLKADIQSVDVKATKVEKYSKKGEFYYANIATIVAGEGKFILEVAADDEAFTEVLKNELKP